MSHSAPVPDRYFERLAVALRGRYTLLHRLGEGGQAAVYLGQDLKLGRQVAIKVLLPEVRAAFGSERFRREVEVVSRLSHPHIVKLFEADEVEGIPFYVMDYVEGESLQQRLEREGPIGLKEALRITAEVGDALQYAHEHGAIHRDIKPANILLSGSHALVTDFGIAKDTARADAETLTSTGVAIGTAPYMSPEQAAGDKHLDSRTDVYSLAAVLYEMLVGEAPFTGKSVQAILARVMVDAPRPLRTTRSGVPPHIEQAILETLSKTPADRPASAGEFLKRLTVEPGKQQKLLLRPLVIAAVALLAVGLGWATWRILAGSSAPSAMNPAAAPLPNSIAVLYFDNLSHDTADVYLADGLTEEVIARLGQVERLQVTSRTAAHRYRGRLLDDPASLGRALGVTYLMSGSLRRSGRRLRVSVELMRATSGVRIWGEQYDHSETDLLLIQEDVARAVAMAVAGELLPAERASLAQRPTGDPVAYDHFLRGNFYLAQRTQGAFAGALREYNAALRSDSGFTRAAARLAYAYALALSWGFTIAGSPPDSILSRGLRAAANAIRRDPDNSDAWMARGYLLKFLNPHTYAGSREALSKAVVLDARNAEAWHQYGSVLYDLGEDTASAGAFRHALAIEPDREITLIEASYLPAIVGRWEEALQLLDSAVAVAPASGNAWAWLVEARLLSGDTAGARRDADVVGQLLPSDPWPQVFAARLAASSGDTVGIRTQRNWLVTWADTMDVRKLGGGFVVTDVVAALVAFGERERALRLLESLQPRNPALGFWLRWPTCDPLRGDPRFQRLVEESRPR